MQFNDLPTEIQFQIFDNFNPSELQRFVAPISKRWHAIASEPILWMPLEFINGECSPQQIVKILNHSLFLRHVIFTKFDDFNWIQHLRKFTTVRYLNFESCQLNARIVTEFIRLFPNVLYIHFDCRIDRDEIFQLSKLKYIKTIRLEVRPGTDANEFLQFFSENCDNLANLQILHSANITNRSWTKFIEAKGAQLIKLSLCGLERLTTLSYHSIEKCLHLTHLRLRGAVNMTDYRLASLQELKSLSWLGIHCGKELFSEGFGTLFKDVTFPRLESLQIARCNNLTNSILQILIRCCPKLRELSLGYLNNLVDDDFELIASACRKLDYLSLTKVDNLTEHCLVDRLAGKMPRASIITANGCPKIRDGKRICVEIRRNKACTEYTISVHQE